MNIEEIMKPYFDKQEEIANRNKEIDKKAQNQSADLNSAKLRLERLKNNRNQEISRYIEEYVQNEILEKRDFYGGYLDLIREDLRKKLEYEYDLKEQRIQKEIDELSKTPIVYSKNYYRVDVRELVEVKESLRGPLLKAQKELELKLREAQINVDTAMLELARFEHKYDENHVCINGNDYRKLLEKRDLFIEAKYDLQEQLKKLQDYMTLIGLTQEEINITMMSMTPWEKEEYDRRKKTVVPEVKEEPTPVNEDTIPTVEEPEVVAESFEELLQIIYSDVIDSAKKLRSVKLDGKLLRAKNVGQEDYEVAGDLEEEKIELPNGVYLYSKDINKALNNYVKQNKGRTFKVKGYNETFGVTRKTINEVKKALRDNSIKKLLLEKKLGLFDIKRVFGKAKAEEMSRKVEMGNVKTKMPSGNYINVEDFMYSLKDVFASKKSSWLERVTQKVKDRFTKKEVEYFYCYPTQEDEVQKTK